MWFSSLQQWKYEAGNNPLCRSGDLTSEKAEKDFIETSRCGADPLCGFPQSSRFFGWRSYWVVLQDGVLSWYSKQ